ncbi:hypothetical protein KBC31_00940 [Candidatus Saccharibacteria bacterium]|jgi:hypothetical protein|nr:hypothetical protein [Candidatus Saccharibacteria bacterium]
MTLIADIEMVETSIKAAELTPADEFLSRMLAVRVELGPGLDPTVSAHLSRMIAVRPLDLDDSAQRADILHFVAADIQEEIESFAEPEVASGVEEIGILQLMT